MDSELSLEMIANEVGVTANYLSAVIRKTTGISLNQCRRMSQGEA